MPKNYKDFFGRRVKDSIGRDSAERLKAIMVTRGHKIQRDFFVKMVSNKNRFGSNREPSLGKYSPSGWNDLTLKYKRAKKAKYPQLAGNSFYVASGELKSSLATLPPAAVLGTPIAEVTKKGGQYRVKVDPFPVLNEFREGSTAGGGLEYGLFQNADELVAHKLGRSAAFGRPFVSNYASWWADRYFKRGMEKIVKEFG